MASPLAQRLSLARHHRFVGRVHEQAVFQSALAEVELPFNILFVFGPGGVGKSALLNEFLYICNQTQTPMAYIDARDVSPTPEAFLKALQLGIGLRPPESPVKFLSDSTQQFVLLIDTYEALAPLDRWLRQDFLPQLPDHVLTVLAGRNPPSLAWRADPGWQTLIRTLSLRNLSPEESLIYLTKQNVPNEQHQAILNFTHGHPLALSLVSDLFAQRRDIPFQPETNLDMIKVLLERLIQKVPGPAHRTALEACAIVRLTTEALLAEMLAMPAPDPALPKSAAGHGVHELFDWLRQLSFMGSGRGGLFPHDLVREALVADLRWRNPDWYAELHRRARSFYTNHLQRTSGHAQQRLLLDYVFLHRDNPVVRPFFEWQASANTLPDVMRESDIPKLVAMVTAHEGEASGKMAIHWFDRQPQGVQVFRDSAEEPAGFVAMVGLHRASAEDVSIDPAVQEVWRYLQQHTPLRSGEKATLFRFWLAHDTYQAVSPIQSLIFVSAVQHYLITPALAFTFFPCANPDFWAPMFAYADLMRIPEADYEVGGHRYGVFGHDWRAVPPAAWLALLAEREVAADVQTTAPPVETEPLVVLSKPAFESAVRTALHDFSLPAALETNPLLRSRLIVERAGRHAADTARAAVLQSVLKEACESLHASPREVKFYRVLHHTYLHPAATQEQAAELLDIPFGTFRRHLKRGISRVVEVLWRYEIGGLEK